MQLRMVFLWGLKSVNLGFLVVAWTGSDRDNTLPLSGAALPILRLSVYLRRTL